MTERGTPRSSRLKEQVFSASAEDEDDEAEEGEQQMDVDDKE